MWSRCWAEAAERNGYLVNLTPFLPGASSRTVALNVMSNHMASCKPMQLARNKQCISEAVDEGAEVVDAIHAAKGAVVIRSENFEKYAGRVKDVIGVAIRRPRPNDGDAAGRTKPGG